jgi:hypothetical protein
LFKRSLVTVVAGTLLLVAGCSSSNGRTSHATTATSTSPQSTSSGSSHASGGPKKLPTVALYYQRIRSASDLSKIGKVDIIVTPRQGQNERAVVQAIHDHGSKAYRYVQSYWDPAGSSYDGLDIGQHMDWAFCKAGSTPLVGRVQGGHKWYYLDTNEKAVRDYFRTFLAQLHEDGYDGVMFDRGLAALTGDTADNPGIWHRSSTCSSDPVKTGATFSDGYVGVLSEVHDAGLKLFLNYGYSPFDPDFPFRPDPRDPRCVKGNFANCHHLSDAFPYIDYFLDEGGAHPKDVLWSHDFQANMANEKDTRFGGRVVVQITQQTLGGDVSPAAVLYQFARIRLFNVPVSLFTGDDGCSPGAKICNRPGLFPHLATADFGTPLTDAPEKSGCVAGSSVDCVWVRRYSQGASILNVSDRTVSTTLTLGTSKCVRVTDLDSGKALAGGNCVTSLKLTLGPWTGQPVMYAAG